MHPMRRWFAIVLRGVPRRRLRSLALIGMLVGVTSIDTPGWAGQPPRAIVRLAVPSSAVPRGQTVTVDYELAQSGPVSIAIVDAQGEEVRLFATRAPAGSSAFVWDLRLAGPSPLDAPEPGPLAPPGRYVVRLTAGTESVAQSFTVGPPRETTRAKDADYAAALDLALKVRQLQSAVNVTARGLRSAQNRARARLDQASGELAEPARAIVAALGRAEADVLGTASDGETTTPTTDVRERLAALARDIDGLNGRPSRALRTRVGRLSSEVERRRTQARQRITPALQAFQAAAKAQGVVPIDLPDDTWVAPEMTTPWPGTSSTDPPGMAGEDGPFGSLVPGDAAAKIPCSTHEIDFDAMGVDFGGWLRRFVGQLKRNWVFPLAAASSSGCVVVSFAVERNGTITDVAIATPSAVAAFNRSAKAAVLASTPTAPLPTAYPEVRCLFKVTFWFNTQPVKREGSDRIAMNPPLWGPSTRTRPPWGR
jgi:TonB family protein